MSGQVFHPEIFFSLEKKIILNIEFPSLPSSYSEKKIEIHVIYILKSIIVQFNSIQFNQFNFNVWVF